LDNVSGFVFFFLILFSAPTGFYERPQDFENYIYLGQMDEWPEDSKMPRAKLLDNLGMAGDVEAEHKALLRVNAVDERDYESFPEVLESLALPEDSEEWTIDPVRELKNSMFTKKYTQKFAERIHISTRFSLGSCLHN
jgi:exoribonuclease R